MAALLNCAACAMAQALRAAFPAGVAAICWQSWRSGHTDITDPQARLQAGREP
jgi:hypothetical protein